MIDDVHSWNVDIEDVGQQPPAKHDEHLHPGAVPVHILLYQRVSYWAPVLKGSIDQFHKSSGTSIEDKVEMALLGITGVPGHTVLTEELSVVRPGYLQFGLLAVKDVDVLVVVEVVDSVGEVLVGKNPDDSLCIHY